MLLPNATVSSQQAAEAALAGLDFLVRNQPTTGFDANCGRYPYLFDCEQQKVCLYTTNWTTGVAVEAMLCGYKLTGRKEYLESAGLGVNYIKSLQEFSPSCPRVQGVFHEVTPQSAMAHPRDALTAAWALLDWHQAVGDDDAYIRAQAYADWFVQVAMEKGFPYWTVCFDETPWVPDWLGSFHSGSAFFLCRMFQATGEQKYCDGMHTILKHYNAHHIDAEGRITVIVDRDTLEPLDGKGNPKWTNAGWEMMHRYNDDFGTLANLAGWKLAGDQSYFASAESFLRRMVQTQRNDGGFGPDEWSVPSAGGAVLMELMAGKRLGMDWISDESLNDAARYLINLQVRQPGQVVDGGFLGFKEPEYSLGNWVNIRATAYAILGLFRYAGTVDNFYFFAD